MKLDVFVVVLIFMVLLVRFVLLFVCRMFLVVCRLLFVFMVRLLFSVLIVLLLFVMDEDCCLLEFECEFMDIDKLLFDMRLVFFLLK